MPLPMAETATQATSSTTTSSGKSIVSGAASSSKRSDSGSMKVVFAMRQQQHRQHAAHEADDHALDHERPADEPVGGADQLHHLDLAAAGEHRQPDRVGDQRDRGEHEQRRPCPRRAPSRGRRRQDLVRVLLAVAHLVDGRRAAGSPPASSLGDDRLQLVGVVGRDAERGRQRVAAQQLDFLEGAAFFSPARAAPRPWRCTRPTSRRACPRARAATSVRSASVAESFR